MTRDRKQPHSLLSGVPDVAWMRAGVAGERWIGVIPFDHDKKMLVLTDSGAWRWIDKRDPEPNLYRLDGAEGAGALPFLEMPPNELGRRLASGSRASGLSPFVVREHLPVGAIIETALETRSNYWADLAAIWLGEYRTPAVSSDALRRASEDRALNQSVRHRLRRHLRLLTPTEP